MLRGFFIFLSLILLTVQIAKATAQPADDNDATENFHEYYNSTIYHGNNLKSFYEECGNASIHQLLNHTSYVTVKTPLPFEFPFYSFPIAQLAVGTYGSLNVGTSVHSLRIPTQYISALMANSIDLSLSENSFVKLCYKPDSYHALWENVFLDDQEGIGPFTFGISLYPNGTIVFKYFSIPVDVSGIPNDDGRLRIGISEACVNKRWTKISSDGSSVIRVNVTEFNKVNFDLKYASNFTMISLTPIPSCNNFKSCTECLENETRFDCKWCPSLKRCSIGIDRKCSEWINFSCDTNHVSDKNMCT